MLVLVFIWDGDVYSSVMAASVFSYCRLRPDSLDRSFISHMHTQPATRSLSFRSVSVTQMASGRFFFFVGVWLLISCVLTPSSVETEREKKKVGMLCPNVET